MTFTEIYTEITQRAGQGYGNFTDRAKMAFWKAVLVLIREKNYSEEDVRGIAKREASEAYLATEFPYSLVAHTAITDDHVFEMQAELRPGYPDTVYYTRMNERAMHRANYMSALKAGGIKEVFYSLKYPLIEIIYDTSDGVLAPAWCYVTVTWMGVPTAMVESTTYDATESIAYLTQGFVDLAVETAVKLMAQET